MPGIEDQIFESMTNATGDDFSGDAPSYNQDVQHDGQGGVPQQVGTPSANEGAPNADDVLTGQDALQRPAVREPASGAQQQSKRERQVGVPEGLYRDKSNRIVDKSGNIYDEKGNVTIPANARKVHDQLERSRNVARELTAENERLRAASQFNGAIAPDVLNGLPAKYNIHQDNLEPVMQIASKFQTDPAGAARQIIEYALSRGVNLRQIVNDEMIPDIQAKALELMLDKRIGPMNRKQEQEQQFTEQQRQGTLAAAQFMEQHPEAEAHRDDIAKLMQEMRADAQKRGVAFDGPSSALTALHTLRNFCFENGLDPNRSIPEQIEERKGQAPANGQQPQVPGRRMPLPNGRGGRGATPMNGKRTEVNGNTSMRDIVAESMAELGMRTN